MIKKLLLLLLTGLSLHGYGQRVSAGNAATFQQGLKVAKTDSERYVNNLGLAYYYLETNRDSAIYYIDRCYQIAKTNNKTMNESWALAEKGYELTRLNKYPGALLCLTQALKLAEDPEHYRERTRITRNAPLSPPGLLSKIHSIMGLLMRATGDTVQSIIQCKAAIRFAEEAKGQYGLYRLGIGEMSLGLDYLNSLHLDSALLLEKEAVLNFKQSGFYTYLGHAYQILGAVYLKKGDPKPALQNFYKAAAADIKYNTQTNLARDYRALAEYYLGQGQPDSSLFYAKRNLEVLQATGSKEVGQAYEDLYKSYELKHQTDSAYKYQGLALVAKDSTEEATVNSLTNFQRLSLKNMLRLQALEKEKEQTQTRIRTSVLLGGTGVLLLLAIIFYRNGRRKQKANYLLQEQKREISAQRDELQNKNYELRIETALEQVRSRSLAMHQSGELKEVIQVIFDQLIHLDFEIDNAGFILDYRPSDSCNVWTADANGIYPGMLHVPYFEHPSNRDYVESRDRGEELFTRVLSFEEKNLWWTEMWKVITGVPEQMKKTLLDIRLSSPALAESRVSLKDVSLYLFKFSGIPYAEVENAILVRFAKVFEQAYTRFIDLQKSESQAREAIKQASVDRVRAEIASMRTTTDLQRITPLLWKELTTLGIPFTRSGVFIVDDAAELIHSYLSTPDGRALTSFDLPLNAEGIARIIVPAWRENQVVTSHWSAEEFAANTQALVDSGAVSETDRMVTEHPGSTLDLHFFPFLQGMLYVGNPTPLSGDEMDQAQSLAAAFSTAYARYEDFNKLESAKRQVENTLAELKSAQNQLVQREKMASLGELTAGIAHEIQNPLNFVNNFSEVSIELLQELKEEVVSGHTEVVVSLADDLAQNLGKINYHGKRADSIVKGMLEHSRSSTGEKQLTDLNLLAEEYLKLSYHGFRAKDKSFNAEFITDFTPDLHQAGVVQQDMGRVLLNLFNNAFYAVHQKRKTAEKDYKPEVSVSTLSGDEGIIIKVRDNGNGIPAAIRDKIMQPFFTTKPTGEGTGLGLSLSYDIVVKGHGGSITVNTREGEFTEFTVTLPPGT